MYMTTKPVAVPGFDLTGEWTLSREGVSKIIESVTIWFKMNCKRSKKKNEEINLIKRLWHKKL